MTPILIIEFKKLPDNVRIAAPHMARIVQEIAPAIAGGEGAGVGPTYEWHIETEVTLDEIREAIQGKHA